MNTPCTHTKTTIRKNDSQTQALPFTVRCNLCRAWWDVSQASASKLLNVPYNMVGSLT